MQGHVVEQYRLHQLVYVVGRRARGGFHGGVRAHKADLVGEGSGLACRAVDQEERRSRLLVVACPLAFAAPGHGFVQPTIA